MAWYALHANAPGDPRKIWGNRILSYIHPHTVYVYIITCVCVHNPVASYYGNAPVMLAYAHAMCTRPFSLLSSRNGLCTRLGVSEISLTWEEMATYKQETKMNSTKAINPSLTSMQCIVLSVKAPCTFRQEQN